MKATVANTSGTMTQPVVITPNNFQQQYSKPNNWRSGNSNRPQGQNHGRNKNFNNKRRWASNNHQQTQLGYSPRPQPQNCPKCGKVHPGVCRMGSNLCYTCGMEGHFSNRCPKKLVSNRLDGPRLNQGRLEAPPTTQQTNARIFSISKEEAEAGPSSVVAGQLSIAGISAYALIDSEATHSFVSPAFTEISDRVIDKIEGVFTTILPSGAVMLSNKWLRDMPIIVDDRELNVNLVVLEMHDYDVILGMDWLSKYNAKIDCHKKRVSFELTKGQKFAFQGEKKSDHVHHSYHL
ncbi:hypothetical protein UlMin_037089 [Ulmus minor]